MRLAWPEGFATLLGIMMVALPAARAAAGPFLAVYPAVVLGAGILLGSRFGRVRLLGGLVTLLVADRALAWLNPPALTASAPAELIALLLPVNLALLIFLPDGPIVRAGRVWLGLLVVEAAVIAGAVRVAPEALATGIALPLFPVDALDAIPVPQIVMILFAGAVGVTGWRAAGRDPVARGLLWASIASFVALAAPAADRTLYFATAGVALVVAMVEASYALAFHDDLTGLPGRRAFNQTLASLSGTYAVAMVDVDHFKQFNDRHGHDVGDQVLKLVANRLAGIEGGGKSFRYGGEEFAVVFPERRLSDAAPYLEALRANIEATTFTLRGKNRPRKAPEPGKRARVTRRKDISVTVSIGGAESSARTKEPASVVKAADQALYRAKGEGRNRVVLDA